LVLPVPVGPGDQPVPVDHPQGQFDRRRRDDRAVVDAASEVDCGPVDGVRGRDRLREIGHYAPIDLG
jgi:hypothetical protein